MWTCARAAGTGTLTAQLLVEKMKGTQTPGMAGLVIREFRAESEAVAGVRRLGAEDPIRRGDRWHLGSDAKALVATLIACLVERGTLAWDRPLARMLPQFGESMHESYRDVTLPELLSHRSGLPRDLGDSHDAFFDAFHDDRTALDAQRLRFLDRALREAPVSDKRAAFSYSNIGYVVAAACAEQATGEPFEALMAAEVFKPLRMASAGFAPNRDAEGPIGHRDGRIADRARDTNPPIYAPAGGILMSLRDWARFCIDQMQGVHGRGVLLREETYRLLHAPQGDTGFAALGWGFLPSAFGRRGPALFHAGSDGNWTALVMLFPETGNGVLVAANAFGSMGGERAANEAMRAIVPMIAEAEAATETP
jgi:CubicO group peptidase (beta-lactamase class C family)